MTIEKHAYLAEPKGLALDPAGKVVVWEGEESGVGTVEAAPERGSSSSFLRASCGVGGVELVAKGKRSAL